MSIFRFNDSFQVYTQFALYIFPYKHTRMHCIFFPTNTYAHARLLTHISCRLFGNHIYAEEQVFLRSHFPKDDYLNQNPCGWYPGLQVGYKGFLSCKNVYNIQKVNNSVLIYSWEGHSIIGLNWKLIYRHAKIGYISTDVTNHKRKPVLFHLQASISSEMLIIVRLNTRNKPTECDIPTQLGLCLCGP